VVLAELLECQACGQAGQAGAENDILSFAHRIREDGAGQATRMAADECRSGRHDEFRTRIGPMPSERENCLRVVANLT
jgi:hypothetical protein